MLKLLIKKLGQYKFNNYNEYAFCCPFCVKVIGRKDNNFHLYVNINNKLYFCHRCGSKGPVKRIVGSNLESSNVKVSDWKNIKEIIKYGRKENNSSNFEVELPRDYMEIIRGSKAHNYLLDRGITDEEIALYKIGFGTENLEDIKYEERRYYAGSGRIIFPDYDENNILKYWVARTYVGHRNKYRNPIGAKSNNQLYGLAIARNYDTVVIVEGVISAIRGGKNCVATYGKNVTQQQILRLTESRFKAYVVALDADAKQESLALATRLSSLGCRNVRVVKYNSLDDDPASVPDFNNLVDLSFSYNFFDLVKEKVLT